MKKVFITGASGFVGSNLVSVLKNDFKVVALVRRRIDYLSKEITMFIDDILNCEAMTRFIEGCDLVFHCAAQVSFRRKDFDKAYQINVLGTRAVLEAAYRAGIKKVVHLSACAVLGTCERKTMLLDERSDPSVGKKDVYAYTKKLAEGVVQEYVEKGLDVSIANIATVYGQGDRRLNSGTIIELIYKGRMKLVPPGGTSFVAVDDLVDGLMLLAQKGKPGERYIFCTDNIEYKDLAQRIAKTLGVKGPRLILPRVSYYPVLFTVRGLELFDEFFSRSASLVTSEIFKEVYRYKYFSAEKAKQELGWKPKVAFEEAVSKAFQFYRGERLI